MKILLMCVCLIALASVTTADVVEITVGIVLPLSGQRSNFGVEALKGINLAADIVNDQADLRGVQVNLLVRDNMGDPSKTAQQVASLINAEHVLAIVGPITSTNAAAAAAVAAEHKTPLVLPAATSPFVTEIGETIVRICITDPYQSKALADFSRQDLKAERVAIVYEKGSDYSEKLAEFYSSRFSDLGGKVVFKEAITPESWKAPVTLDAALAEKPEVLFLPLYYPEAAEVVTYLSSIDNSVVLLGGDGWDSPELFRRAGESISPGKIFISSHYSSDQHTSVGDEFAERFQNKYESTPNAISALGYDALMVLADAVDRSTEVTRSGVSEALSTTEDFQGVTGRITINEKRNALKDVFILKALKDRFVLHTRISNF